MTRKGKTQPSERVLRKIPTRSSYTLGAETAVELEIYAMSGKYGPKQNILDAALKEWYGTNPLKPKVREAAMVLLEEGLEND